MKLFKKAFTLSLAVLLAGGMGITSIKAEDEGTGGGTASTPETPETDTSEPTKAGTGAYSITIENAVKGHKYVAYQILTGEKDETASTAESFALTNIAWGADITEAGQAAVLAAYNAKDVDEFVKNYINEKGKSHTQKAIEFAALLTNVHNAETGSTEANTTYLTANAARTNTKDTNGSLKFSDLACGYYLVVDSYPGTGEEGVDYTISRTMVQVVDDAVLNNKADKPSLEKKIVGVNDVAYDTPVKQNTAGIGSKINYIQTSVVPEMAEYSFYMFIIEDTMDKGITFNGDDVVVKIGDKTLTQTTDKKSTGETFYVVTGADAAPYSFKIVLCNFIQYASLTGKPIEVTYSGTLNEVAELGTVANKNVAHLTYSHNPLILNNGGLVPTDPSNPSDPSDPGKPGTPDESTPYEPKKPENPGNPDPNDPANPDNPWYQKVNGVTPDVIVNTFATALKIHKVDAITKEALPGAAFTLTATKRNAIALSNGEFFDVDENGTWYLLKDGTFTETSPTDETKENYMAPIVKYSKVTVGGEGYAPKVDVDTIPDEATFVVHGVVDDNGDLIISGLDAGVYTLKETKAPVDKNGNPYNELNGDYTVDIKASFNGNALTSSNLTDAITWTADLKFGSKDEGSLGYGEDFGDYTGSKLANGFVMVVENTQGHVLPETGGMGTTLFYIIGGVLAVGAGVLLVAKKRLA